MDYVVVGKIAEPTDAQMRRAENTGGWREVPYNGRVTMWNPCVSPPFGGRPYEID